MKKRNQQKLIMLTITLVVAFNAPLLLIFDEKSSSFGLPLVYLYIFSLWFLSILITKIIMGKNGEK